MLKHIHPIPLSFNASLFLSILLSSSLLFSLLSYSFHQALPRTIPVDSISAIDATILSDPEVKQDSLSFKPRCEFVSAEEPLTSSFTPPRLPSELVCGGSQKMVTIAITDMVARSAALVYYKVLISL